MDEVIIFRNFSDCRHKFETSLLPRRKDQYDTYRLITPTNHTGNVYVTGYTKGGTISKTLGETIADESPTYYASFLRLFDKHDYAELLGTNLCANQIFNPTSMCAYSNALTRALPPCFENSLRAIDSSKNQPNRLRFDRAREF